ncbi:MAG: hypothetical protein J5506_01435 [Prevotella sp.]|nr:hypothetical protein [Prevotella sp.]
MKNTVIIILLALLAGCNSPQNMRQALVELDSLNKGDLPLPDGDSLAWLTNYFNSHGTPNEQMTAHYLRGRAYATRGQAPQAAESFHDAIQSADTTQTNCDFRLLSKTYGQLAETFYEQNLMPEMLHYNTKAIMAAKHCNDTLYTLLYTAQRTKAFERTGQGDSLIALCDSLLKQSDQYGFRNIGAGVLGIGIIELSKKKQFEKAAEYIRIYEQESGFFDQNNNIATGREIYYYNKGQFFLMQNKLDSAEYYFRKELHTGKDLNNQNAGSKGLAEVYRAKNMPDSATKYSMRAYLLNDSVNASMAIQEVARTKAMYDYSRSQRMAVQKEKEARLHASIWHLLLFVLICVAISGCWFINKERKKKQREKAAYQQSLAILENTRTEVNLLKKHEHEYQMLIEQKEALIDEQLAVIEKYQRKEYRGTKTAEKHLQASENYNKLLMMADTGQQLTDQDFMTVKEMVHTHFPQFYDYLISNSHLLNANEYRLCLLTRLHINPIPISHMLNVSPSYVTKMRKEVSRKLFQKELTGKKLELHLSKIG